MSTTEQRLEHLRFNVAASHRPPAEASVRYSLILALVGVAALLAWGLLAGPSGSTQRPGPSAIAGDQQHFYDGHGKWSGYMAPSHSSHMQMLRDAGIIKQP